MTEANPERLEFALKDAEHAFRLLEFSIRVLKYLELPEVDFDLFGEEMTILLEQENITFNDGYFTSATNAKQTAGIAVGANFGATAIALDNLFEATGRQRNLDSTAEFDTLWALIYAVRNAFAHGIANPTWNVKESRRRKINIALAGNNTVVDLAALHDCAFEYTQIGGFGNWLRIKDRAFALIRE
ncbi:MAG: hypothetical protein IT565_08905 [Rhodospirillales bacterium]|nr:hypothetical protein [Rhodospirillales bacterium]